MTQSDQLHPKGKYSKRSDLISFAIVITHLSFVLIPTLLAAAVGPQWGLVLLWLWAGISMNGIINLMHEACHYHVFKWKSGSDILGKWIISPLVMVNFDQYRARHWEHHRNLGSDLDPKHTYHISIKGWRRFAFHIVRCFLLIEALSKFTHQLGTPAQQPVKKDNFWFLRVCIVQGIFVLLIVAIAYRANSGNWKLVLVSFLGAYGFVYVYGIMSLTVLLANLRGIAEHQIDDDDRPLCGKAALRNFDCSFPSRILFGSYGFGEHYTHHELANIPYYHLKSVTRELSGDDVKFNPRSDYLNVILRLTKAGSKRD